VEPLAHHDVPRDEGTLPVLKRNVFRRPRGRLLRPDTAGRLVQAHVRIGGGAGPGGGAGAGRGFEVVRGTVPAEVEPRLKATLEDDPSITGDWGLCRGAFGHVLAEIGAPIRAIESLSSSTSFAHLLDGATRLDQCAERLAEVAGRLERLAAEGWTLSQPIAGFWFRLRYAPTYE
jgi:hypothetical protein